MAYVNVAWTNGKVKMNTAYAGQSDPHLKIMPGSNGKRRGQKKQKKALKRRR
jgi:hypothetical protein